MERLDGREKWSVVESPRERRSVQTVVLNEAVFVQHLGPGSWHLAFYNDGKEREMVSFNTAVLGGFSHIPSARYRREVFRKLLELLSWCPAVESEAGGDRQAGPPIHGVERKIGSVTVRLEMLRASCKPDAMYN